MKNTMNEYNKWVQNENLDINTREELNKLSGNEEDIYEAFYRELEFGTAGLRGIMGVGTNRMNVYVIGKVTQGLADYMNEKFENPSIAISYDSRINSFEFAKKTASVMAANGIKAYIYKNLMPVSALSFAVRALSCDMGVMITASHNPKEYNGYKVYNNQGCQILGTDPQDILRYIGKVDIFNDVKDLPFEEALQKNCEYISEETENMYIDKAYSYSLEAVSLKDFKLIYTPLNGAGNLPVKRVLKKAGLKNVLTVREQELPDGNFPTCPYPNPELKEVYNLAIDLCRKEDGDLIIATDPDCDRVGVAVKNGNEFVCLKGNHIGVLLFDYICKVRELPKEAVAIRTIVSTPLMDEIAKDYNVKVDKTLIGFKYIGEKIHTLKEKYVFGFEEGNGYLAGEYVRDKDGVSTSMLVCQMAAYYKDKGKTLLDALRELYDKYGFFEEKVLSFTFEGSKGSKKIEKIMESIRKEKRKDFMGKKATSIIDYSLGEEYFTGSEAACCMVAGTKPTGLPKENIMEFTFTDNSKIIVRPSGTEPKIKVYLFAKEKSKSLADKKIEDNEEKIRKIIENE